MAKNSSRRNKSPDFYETRRTHRMFLEYQRQGPDSADQFLNALTPKEKKVLERYQRAIRAVCLREVI